MDWIDAGFSASNLIYPNKKTNKARGKGRANQPVLTRPTYLSSRGTRMAYKNGDRRIHGK